MKTILYMAESVNGYIAKEGGDTSWIGENDLQKFREITKEAGNVVMGRKTYEYMLAIGKFPLPNRLNVVMSREQRESDNDQVLFTPQSPVEVINLLTGLGYEKAMIIGGGNIAKSFLAEHLIDELFVTIEPIIFGRGIPFLEQSDLEIKLELLETIHISESEIQLHYKVIR